MLPLLRISWLNIGRNPRRSILSILAVAFATAVLIFAMALQQGSYADMIYNTVHTRTGNLQLQHSDYWPTMRLEKRLKSAGELLAALATTPGIKACAPRIRSSALVSSDSGTFGALIQGIDPGRESDTSTLATVMCEGEFLGPDDREGAILGVTLAKNLGVSIHDEIVFLGQGADGSLAAGTLTIRGTFKTGIAQADRSSLAAHIDTIAEAFSLYGGVTEISVLLEHDRQRPAVASAINSFLTEKGRTDVRVLGWPTLMPGVEESIKLDWYSGQIVYLVLVFVVGLGIANTFLMAYLERLHEFGVLLALGLKSSRLAFLVFAESALLTMTGIGAGLCVGTAVVLYFQHQGIHFGQGTEELMAEYGMSGTIHPLIIPLVLHRPALIVLSVALILAVYPAWKASRLLPTEGLGNR